MTTESALSHSTSGASRARTLMGARFVVGAASVLSAALLAGCTAWRPDAQVSRQPAGTQTAKADQTGAGSSTAAATGGTSATTTGAADSAPLPRMTWVIPAHAAALTGPVMQGPGARKEVALTFDACESEKPAGFDTKMADILERERVSATIFIGGKWLAHNQDAAKRVAADERFEIGAHSWDHPDFTKLTTEAIRSQVSRTDALTEEVTGRKPVLFRLPYGTYDDRVLGILRSMRVPIIQWSVVSGDPDPNVSAGAMTREILARAEPGSIVIMHINGRGVHTAEALPDIIRGLRAKGFDLVTVSALLR